MLDRVHQLGGWVQGHMISRTTRVGAPGRGSHESLKAGESRSFPNRFADRKSSPNRLILGMRAQQVPEQLP